MSFEDLGLKRSYDSYTSNLVEEFFNPVLSEAKVYMRAAAFFSSSSFKAMGRGLSRLLSNGGSMKLLVSVVVSEEDYNAIVEGKKQKEEAIASIFTEEGFFSEMLKNDSVNALCKLVSSGRLEMKFLISKRGIFHMKFGILEDWRGNLVSFSGSLNETFEGYKINGEEFKVFRSWAPGENEYVLEDYRKFAAFWDMRLEYEGIIVSELPQKIRDKIGNVNKIAINSGGPHKLSLRPYQANAVDFFSSKGFSAILEMATGTGKTLVAMHCAMRLYETVGKKFTVIAVPTKSLALQWKKAWEEFFGNIPFLYDPNRKGDFYNYCRNFQNEGVAILTYSSLSKNEATEIFNSTLGPGTLFIADEAHWLGAQEFSRAMRFPFKYRLGLSATPERMFDEEGTEKLLAYFGNNEFEFSLVKAISGGYLSEFNYWPYFCKLGEDEIEEYSKQTKKALSHSFRESEEKLSANEIALIKRSKVAKKAKSKTLVFSEIIGNLSASGKLNHLLAFFEDHDQLKIAQQVLFRMNVPFDLIDSSTDAQRRETASKRLEKGEISCILSMRVMDEGVDIPSAKREIIMASSSNERQYIQRAGRILRLHRQEIAEIYDIIAYCEPGDCPDWLWKYESSTIKKEIKRAMYFCNASSNKSSCIVSLHEFGSKINILIWE